MTKSQTKSLDRGYCWTRIVTLELHLTTLCSCVKINHQIQITNSLLLSICHMLPCCIISWLSLHSPRVVWYWLAPDWESLSRSVAMSEPDSVLAGGRATTVQDGHRDRVYRLWFQMKQKLSIIKKNAEYTYRAIIHKTECHVHGVLLRKPDSW